MKLHYICRSSSLFGWL